MIMFAVPVVGCGGAPVAPSSAGAGPSASAGPVSGRQAVAGVTVLARDDDWRPGLPKDPRAAGRYAVVEIAYDDATARIAWQQNRPAATTARSGPPQLPGIYGTPQPQDPSRLLVVYSSGQSGSCTSWVRGIETGADRTVRLTTATDSHGNDMCLTNYRAYRLVLLVDRRLLPAAADLPSGNVLIDGAKIGHGGNGPIVTRYLLPQ
jgi:hypothetical protein